MLSGLINASINTYKTISGFLSGDSDVINKTAENITVAGQNVISVNKQTLFRPLILISDTLNYADIKTLKTIVKTEVNIYTTFHIRAIQTLINLNGVEPQVAIFRTNTGLNSDDVKRYVGDGIVASIESDGHSNSNVDKSKLIEDAMLQTYDLELTNTVVDPITKQKVTKAVTIPIIIYPVIRFVNLPDFVESITNGRTSEATFKERWREYKAGAISLSDLIFATDLVKEYKRKSLQNDNDVAKLVKNTLKVRSFQQLQHYRAKYKPRFIGYVCSIEDKPYLDRVAKGNIFQDKYKDIIMDLLFALEIGLVDLDSERLTLMIDGLRGFSTYDLELLKTKNDNIDVNDLFKNILTNRSPF